MSSLTRHAACLGRRTRGSRVHDVGPVLASPFALPFPSSSGSLALGTTPSVTRTSVGIGPPASCYQRRRPEDGVGSSRGNGKPTVPATAVPRSGLAVPRGNLVAERLGSVPLICSASSRTGRSPAPDIARPPPCAPRPSIRDVISGVGRRTVTTSSTPGRSRRAGACDGPLRCHTFDHADGARPARSVACPTETGW